MTDDYSIESLPDKIRAPALELLICNAGILLDRDLSMKDQYRKDIWAQSFAVNVLANFVAPWARGHNIGRRLMQTAEDLSVEKGYALMQLDVRETQKTAIELYEDIGYKRWGENPHYAHVDGQFIKGFYYNKIVLPLK